MIWLHIHLLPLHIPRIPTIRITPVLTPKLLIIWASSITLEHVALDLSESAIGRLASGVC